MTVQVDSGVFTGAWWIAAGKRAAYTALAAILPSAALLLQGGIDPLYVAGLAGLALVLSLLTSMASLPELDDKSEGFLKAVGFRVLRTLGQVGVPALAGAAILQDVDWHQAWVVTAGAVLTTLIRALMSYLPETTVVQQIKTGEVVDPTATPTAVVPATPAPNIGGPNGTT